MAVKWTGLTQLKAKLNDISKMDEVKQIVKLNGAELQIKAQRNSPVDTGQLKRSIMLSMHNNGLTAEVSANTNYAAYVEYGTRYMDAQPYMHPAYEEQSKIFLNDLHRLTGD